MTSLVGSVFFFKQKTAYEIGVRLVGSEMCIRDRNMDYPAKSDDWLKYVNSRKENGKIKIIIRDLVRGGDSYEHSDK